MAPDVESALDGGIVTKPVGHHGVLRHCFSRSMNTNAAVISETNSTARGRLGARRIVVTAILHLVGTYGFDDDEAYQHLRKESMRKRISVEELSARLVACGQGRHRIKNTEA